MITLKTLKQATSQEVFDQVANHLLTQGQKSQRGSQCFYQLNTGDMILKCAAGCLISPDEYDEKLEQCAWDYIVQVGAAPYFHSRLIKRLQRIHDSYNVDEWPKMLELLAYEMSLTWKVNRD